MKRILKYILFLILPFCALFPLSAQKNLQNIENSIKEKDFTDRKEIIETIENFYIGDHTGSVKHKKLSMDEKGAYRYVDKDGKYSESAFQLDSDNADPNYQEELLSIEIYDKVALARLRLDQFRTDKPEYKLMTLHKTDNGWKITSICWGFGITQ